MKLPNAERSIVDERKIRDYLLSRSHPVGRFKSSCFARAGFGPENVELLITQLRDFALDEEAQLGDATEYGQKYLISGTLRGASGSTLEITSVWIVPATAGVPRHVTVYPR